MPRPEADLDDLASFLTSTSADPVELVGRAHHVALAVEVDGDDVRLSVAHALARLDSVEDEVLLVDDLRVGQPRRRGVSTR